MHNFHYTDKFLSARDATRTIQNWSNYKTPSGLWCPTNLNCFVANSPPEHWSGTFEFIYNSLEAPIQIFLGDTTDYNSALIGARLTDRPDYWFNMKALGQNQTEMIQNDFDGIWNNLWNGGSLKFSINSHRIEKLITITDKQCPRKFQFSLKLAPNHTFDISNNRLSIKDSIGIEWIGTQTLWAKDANENFLKISMYKGDLISINNAWYPTFWIELDEEDYNNAQLPIEVDPITAIAGTTAIEDTILYEASPNNSYGGFSVFAFGKTASHQYRGLIRIDETYFPSGDITGFRYFFWRYAAGSSYTAGSFTNGRIISGNDWPEGTNAGVAATGDCTWNYVRHDTQAWLGSAGCSTAGVDFGTSGATTISLPLFTSGSTYKIVWNLTPLWATQWKSGATVNEGFIVYGDGTLGNLVAAYSTESAVYKPSFEVDVSHRGNPLVYFRSY